MSTQEAFEPATTTRQGRSTAMRWWLFAPAIVVIWILGMIDKTGVGIIAANKNFLADMTLAGEPAEIGLLTTITLLFYGASMPAWGWLIDKFGVRRCATVGLVFWGISTLICGLAPNYLVLLGGRALLGVSEGFLWPASNVLTARWFPLSERSRAQSVWIGAINLGFALSGFVINGAIGAWTWRGAFFLLSGLAIVVCVPVAWFLMRDDPARERRVSAEERAHIEADTLDADAAAGTNELRTWPYWIMVVAWIANNMGVFGLASWFPTYLKAQGVSGTTASDYIALAFVLCIVVAPFVGLSMDRFHRKAIWSVAGFLIAAVFLLLAGVVPTTGFKLAAVIVAIVGIEGMTTLAGQSVLHGMAPVRRIGRANGIMSGVGNFVGSFGSLIMGGLIGVGGFTAAFTFLIVVFAIGAGLNYALHRLKY
jgi:MFS family permease